MKSPIMQALSALFLAFPSQERTDNEKQLGQVYLMAVEDIPADFVAVACKRFIQGQVERANLTFRPTPAELAHEARRLRDKALELQRYDTARLPKPVTNEPPEPTPEERARAAERWRKVRAEIEMAATVTMMPKGSRFSYRQPTLDELIDSRDRIAAWEQEQRR